MAVLLAILYLARLGSDPPGLYDDEASIGYNAWTIAHFGIDQYGNHLPLFFPDFGDYKAPVATYMVAPLAWFLPLTAATVRLPSVLSGIAVFLVAGRLAAVLSGSRTVSVLVMLLTAAEPWVFLQSQTVLEGNIQMVLCITVACWCLAEAARGSDRWWWGAGAALGIGAFTYSIARLLVPLVALAALLGFWQRGWRAMGRLLLPLVVAAAVMAAWSAENPGALLARYGAIGLFSDHPSVVAAAVRFATNYLSYLSPQFLLFRGDGNLRESTGFGGVLLAVAVPLILIGIWRLWRRRSEPFARFALLGALFAPIPAALAFSDPFTLRGAGLIPFAIVFLAEGVAWVLSAGSRATSRIAAGWRRLVLRPPAIAAALVAATLACAVPYFVDFFTAYQARASAAFETGEGPALLLAWEMARDGGHELYLSAALNQPLIQLQVAADAPPPQQTFVQSGRIEVVTQEAQLASAHAGDIGVLGPDDQVPPGGTLLFVVRGGEVVHAPATASHQDLLRVYRLS